MTRLPSASRSGARRHRCLVFAASLLAGWSLACAAAADEVKVLTAEAFQPVVSTMATVFEKRTGHKLVVVRGSIDTLARRIREGEEFDLAILPPALLEALGKDGAVSDGSIIPLARTASAVYAGAVSTSASSDKAALSLLILLASEETQLTLKSKGLSAP